ncbi:ABC transporter permease [Methylomonas sp. AM2-LC]|uniref:MlaE family ABC transporter permease n=1 Tax=Methylomonas sp. AM2-LC TaxID=3153301 RepID=UPI0032643A83
MPNSEQQISQISSSCQNDLLVITVKGDWLLTGNLPSSDAILLNLKSDKDIKRMQFSTAELGNWDSLLPTELIKLIDAARQQDISVELTSLPFAIQRLLTLVYASPERHDTQQKQDPSSKLNLLGFNQTIINTECKLLLTFIGDLFLSTVATLRGQSFFRLQDFYLYIQECGPSALPIVTLISLLVGLILAFVGALQLSLFGAQIYIANLVSLGMTREMGGLMTAIIMTGRTGAAYAAQLGTMQVNSEIDALKTMNLEPMAFLVIPRVLALILIMPLLCLYADLMGIVGGGLVTVNFFDVSITEYLDRTAHAVQLKDFLVGFVKSAVFGILIALSGCMRGMQCGRSASAVGNAATSAVVTGIVFIVMADSLMTIICNRLGI